MPPYYEVTAVIRIEADNESAAKYAAYRIIDRYKWQVREVDVLEQLADVALDSIAEARFMPIPSHESKNKLWLIKLLDPGAEKNKIGAIKLVRSLTDWGLRDSKMCVERVEEDDGKPVLLSSIIHSSIAQMVIEDFKKSGYVATYGEEP